TIKVHALKSSAMLIGAAKLSEGALALENAGKEENLAYIREHTEEVLNDYAAYSDILRPLFEEERIS
ncbi:MAG: hypothetical protein K6E53_09995, partial [Lachnospiraceae bacterium]|nr:hypothetical protein [Lachnospiraceae bacterium]